MSLIRMGAISAGVLLAGAVPSLAQTPSCGGSGANGVWIGGSMSGSDVSTASFAFDTFGSAANNGEIVTLFSLTSPTEVRVEASPSAGMDTVIDLISSNGSFIISDDDGGGGLASRAEVMLQPGSYCLLTRGLGGDAVAADIRVGRTDHEPLTSGGFVDAGAETCTIDTPATMLNGSISAGSGARLMASNPVSVEGNYRFFTDGSAPITITASNENADPVVYVYDELGNLIAENDDFDGLNSRIDLDTPPSAGTYCISLSALSDENAPIDLAVYEFDEGEFLTGLYDRGESAPPMDGSYPVTVLGSLENRMREDVRVQAGKASWFAINMPENGVILIEAIAIADVDPTITMYDDLGRQVGFNDDNGDTLDSLLAVRVNPGLHMFAVNLLGESGGAIRLAMERYVRVP